MAEVAAYAAVLVGKVGEVEAVVREILDYGHRGVAPDAKIPEFAASLALTALVHGDEHGVLGGIGMHAARPLAIVIGVATLASLRIA
jgi:hypothetical protein